VSSTHSTSNEFLRRTKSDLLKGNKANNEANNEKIAKKINPKVPQEKINEIILGLQENGITIDEKEFIGDTFIDIGCNCGHHSILAACLVGVEGKVISFEPNKKLVTLLETHISVEKLQKITLLNKCYKK
jgi:hypothetical protein